MHLLRTRLTSTLKLPKGVLCNNDAYTIIAHYIHKMRYNVFMREMVRENFASISISINLLNLFYIRRTTYM